VRKWSEPTLPAGMAVAPGVGAGPSTNSRSHPGPHRHRLWTGGRYHGSRLAPARRFREAIPLRSTRRSPAPREFLDWRTSACTGYVGIKLNPGETPAVTPALSGAARPRRPSVPSCTTVGRLDCPTRSPRSDPLEGTTLVRGADARVQHLRVPKSWPRPWTSAAGRRDSTART